VTKKELLDKSLVPETIAVISQCHLYKKMRVKIKSNHPFKMLPKILFGNFLLQLLISIDYYVKISYNYLHHS
jgi:hypothetical protein